MVGTIAAVVRFAVPQALRFPSPGRPPPLQALPPPLSRPPAALPTVHRPCGFARPGS